MALMHHNKLRVNAVATEDPDQMAVLRESGWASGPHKDTDPDDPRPVPGVLPGPEPEPEPEPEQAAKAAKNVKD